MQPHVDREAAEVTGLLMAWASSDNHERDQQDYEAALALLDDVDRYVPCSFPTRPLELETCTDVDSLKARLFERGEPTSTAPVFGAFRARVTELEAIGSKRLEVLTHAMRKLAGLRGSTNDAITLANIRSALERLHYHLNAFWQLQMPDDAVDLRSWSMRVTREYLLLPADWRHL